MSQNYKENTNSLPEYLTSLIRLSELQKMTDHLDDELADSQKIMSNIKTMFDSIPKAETSGSTENNVVRHEDLSQFLVASPPQLLMADMPNTMDVDLDVILTTMKAYAEDLRKNFVNTQPPEFSGAQSRTMDNLDLVSYASSLDHLVKRLAHMKLNNRDEASSRDAELEDKLNQLCKDVHMFTQMVEAKKAMNENRMLLSDVEEINNVLYYDNIINKLLAGINEVTYLLQNKN